MLTPVCGAVCNDRKRCLPTHGGCERVARERAGGEGGFLFATRKAENRVPPSSKAASEIAAASLQWQFHAGRANQKKQYKRLFFSQTPQKGCGEKRKGVSPRRARSAPWGAGRGAVSRAVKPCIKHPQPLQPPACRTTHPAGSSVNAPYMRQVFHLSAFDKIFP